MSGFCIRFEDYMAFGSIMPGRKFSSDYRYGFNGMERDDEVKNVDGSSLDFGARMYDPRIGRWLILNHLATKYPSYSDYSFVINSPLIFVDPDGRDLKFANKKSAELFYSIYNSADEETRQKLDKLDCSEVIYNVDVRSSLEGRNGGVSPTWFKKDNAPDEIDILVDKHEKIRLEH